MERVTVLDDDLWPTVPAEILAEAKAAAKTEPCWIARREDGHFIASDQPQGGPDTATGDLVYVAEVSPANEQPAGAGTP